MELEIEKIICNLIQTSLDLPDNYGTNSQGIIPCVMIKAQNIKLFTTDQLQITVSTLSNRVYANNTDYITDTDTDGNETYYERTCVNEQRLMQIDMYSRNNEARERYWEVSACLTSTLAQQLQEQYQFRISGITTATNLSGLDGGSDINRFTIRFNCLTWNKKLTEVDYYTTFPATIQANNDDVQDLTIETES